MLHRPVRMFGWSILSTLFLFYAHSESSAQLQIDSKTLSADIVRIISKDLFDLNSIPFMQPMVETFNAAANAGLYGTAHIPAADTFYARIGLRATAGLVRDDQKTYRPHIPTEPTENEVAGGLALLIANRIKEIFKRGMAEDSIRVPERSGTILGNTPADFHLNNDYLLREIRKDTLYQQAVEFGLDPGIIDQAITGLPDVLALPGGADISTIIAVVPQVEVGAVYGTDLLLRFIPPVRLDTNVGRFSFWGIGLRHNLSQWFTDDVDIALLAAYQRTSLTNTVGVTRAELQAEGSTFNGTLCAGRTFGRLSLYGGVSLQRTEIDITYLYTLPRQLQAQLGLIAPKDLNGDGRIDDDEFVPDPANGFPGDTKPQTSRVRVTETGISGTLGVSAAIGPVRFVADLNVGMFNVLSAGIAIEF